MKPTPEIPTFILWKWKAPEYRTSYEAKHVNHAVRMLRREGVPIEKILCVTDDPEGVQCRTHPLWTDHSTMKNVSGKHLPSCYRRLKLFDPATQEAMGLEAGKRVVSLDIDLVILKDFLKLFDRKERYVGWQVPGSRHRAVFNGSMWMFTTGDLAWVWTDFRPEKSPATAFAAGYMGSDQGYLSHQLITRDYSGGWTSARDGVLSYARDVRALRVLSKHGRVVFFAGAKKPWDLPVRQASPWISRYVEMEPPSVAQSVEPALAVA